MPNTRHIIMMSHCLKPMSCVDMNNTSTRWLSIKHWVLGATLE